MADAAKRSLHKAEICHGSSGERDLRHSPCCRGPPRSPSAPPGHAAAAGRSVLQALFRGSGPVNGEGARGECHPGHSPCPAPHTGRGRERADARPPRYGHGALGGRARPVPRSPAGRSRGQAGSGPCLQVPGLPESARRRLPRPAAPDSRERGAPGLSVSLEPAGRGRAAPDLGGPIASQVQSLAPTSLCKCLRI